MAAGMAGMGFVAGMAAPPPDPTRAAAHRADSPEDAENRRLLPAGSADDSCNVREGAALMSPYRPHPCDSVSSAIESLSLERLTIRLREVQRLVRFSLRAYARRVEYFRRSC